MSRTPFLKAVLIGIALTCAGVSVSSCGFQPLYADKGLNTTLSEVEVTTSQIRTGFLVKQDLSKGLREDIKADKRFLLDITLKENRYSVGLNVDDTASRYELSTSVSYTLTEIESGKILHRGGFTDTTTYDVAESPYANMASQLEGQERAASSISQKIQTELALYFRKPK